MIKIGQFCKLDDANRRHDFHQINQVINVKNKKNNKQGWWDRFASHLGRTDLESAKNGTTKQIFIALVALIGFVTFCITGFYLGTVMSVSNAAATIGKDNPEIIAGNDRRRFWMGQSC
jgi:hypothetical protein